MMKFSDAQETVAVVYTACFEGGYGYMREGVARTWEIK